MSLKPQASGASLAQSQARVPSCEELHIDFGRQRTSIADGSLEEQRSRMSVMLCLLHKTNSSL